MMKYVLLIAIITCYSQAYRKTYCTKNIFQYILLITYYWIKMILLGIYY